MYQKFLSFLYYKNYFKLIVYILKIISLFDKKYTKQISFYNFFKKRKIKYKKKILKNLYQPKIFIFQFTHDTEEVIKKIYNYDKLYQKNSFDNDGHIGVYQSEHNLEKNDKFIEFSKILQTFINKKLESYFDKKFLIKKLWFVITKSLGKIRKHSHLDSDMSGVLYLKVDQDEKNDNGLRIYNCLNNIEIYRYSLSENRFTKSVSTNEDIILKPKKNELIIFNSYLEHGVENNNLKEEDRISLPFDLIFED